MEEHVLEQSNPHQGGRNGEGEEKGRETEGERGHTLVTPLALTMRYSRKCSPSSTVPPSFEFIRLD